MKFTCFQVGWTLYICFKINNTSYYFKNKNRASQLRKQNFQLETI